MAHIIRFTPYFRKQQRRKYLSALHQNLRQRNVSISEAASLAKQQLAARPRLDGLVLPLRRAA